MKEDSFDYTAIKPLHTFAEYMGNRAQKRRAKGNVRQPPCTYCPHLGQCSEQEVACVDFALYVDSDYQFNELIVYFSHSDPRQPLHEVYSLIFKGDE